MLKQIYTKRFYESRNFWDLVYEWEDCISHTLQIPIVKESKLFDRILKGIPGLYWINTRGRLSLCFQMGAEIVPTNYKKLQEILGLRAKNIEDVIPVIIDFWQPASDIMALNRAYSRNKVVLVSSAEAIKFLNDNNAGFNYVHWPLSLPDLYAITPQTAFEKKYDLAMMGRQNPLLEEFLKKYIETHPDFVYAFKKREDGHFNYYTNRGEFVGCADDRIGYLQIMRGAKCGLYATPGLDEKSGSNGYNQVTPRFLELLSSGCHVIARYPENPDTDFFHISDFSDNIDSYSKFEEALDKARASEVDMKKYSDYLSKHYTSVRAKQLQEILNGL